jgi:DNA-binding CsgD family transcriptional regulator
MQKSYIIKMLSKGLSEDEIKRLTGISEKDFREIMGL